LSVLVLARVRLACGDLDTALELSLELRRRATSLVWLEDIARAFDRQLHYTRGDFAAPYSRRAVPVSPQVLWRPRLLPYACEHLWVEPVQASLAEARAKGDELLARHALVQLDELAPRGEWLHWLQVKRLILRALARDLLADREAALADVELALALSEAERGMRAFIDEGAPMLDL